MNTVTYLESCEGPWPVLDYNAWNGTLNNLHQWVQIIGKIRLRLMPWQNHCWHTALYVSSSGITTGDMPYGHGMFSINLNFKEHRLELETTFGNQAGFALKPMSTAHFYKQLFDLMKREGIEVKINKRPNELEFNTPFDENEAMKDYDPIAVNNFWQVLISVQNILQKFRSEFTGKSSPVHLFWGAFDLAYTRFSGRKAPRHPGVAPNLPAEIMQEAYSREVSSCGFWPGSEAFPHAAFYAYAYPTPEGYSAAGIQPEQAFWSDELGEYLLLYETLRTSQQPEVSLLNFFRSAYQAASETGHWDKALLENSEPRV